MSSTGWPMFFSDQLKMGNLNSCVAICTLWSKKENIHEKIDDDKYCICGNLYTAEGINYLIKNIFSYPKIRYIIVCGKEMNDSGTSFINFMEKGVDDKGRIIGSNSYIDSNISGELIEKFRTGVKMIDMRGREDQIAKLIETLPEKEPFSEPIIIEDSETRHSTLASENFFLINERTISESWLKILDIIMKYGEIKESDYGIRQKEVLDLMVVVEEEEGKIECWLKFKDNDLKDYFSKFFSSERPDDISYTYGERLFKYPLKYIKEKWTGEISSTFNQIENIIEQLKKSPHTRRAIAFTWNMDIDAESKSPPCLTQITWNIKNGVLYQTAILRSNDMFGAWPMNAFALRKLQKNIASRLNVQCGSLVTISNSAHIYENNWKECGDILNEYYTGKGIEFDQDKLGYFILKIEEDEIVVEHHLQNGRKSNFVFRGKDAKELYRKILNENLVSRYDHAAYLGRELTRAETALREGKRYDQE